MAEEFDDKLEELNKLIEESPPDNLSLKVLVDKLFPGKDGRAKEGFWVKQQLALKGIDARRSQDYQYKRMTIPLNDSQKEFINNNAKDMNPLEIAKTLFPDKQLFDLSPEVQTIKYFITSCKIASSIPDLPKYRSPKTIAQTLKKVNECVFNYPTDIEKLTSRQQRDLESLTSYLNNMRFVSTLELFTVETERQLLENVFINYTYDKNDLSAEEVSGYVNWSMDVVNSGKKQKQIEKLATLLEQTAEDSEGRKISVALADAIHNAETEMNQNKIRQQKLMNELSGKRSDRIKDRITANASVLSLVEAWKQQDMRGKMVELAKEHEEALDGEIERLNSLDELKARIFGISKEEILYGR